VSYTGPSITASGTTFAQFQAGGASGHLERLIAAQSLTPTAAPTSAPTLAASGSGNTLAANTYYVVVTETNGLGETAASPASASQVVSAAQKLTVTFPTLKTGNTARNVYLGLSSTGPWSLYATGITTATFDCTVAAPANSYAVSPPAISTSGLTYTDANGVGQNRALVLLRGAKTGNLQDAYRSLARVIEEFNSGQPMSSRGVVDKLRQCHFVFSALATLCSEAGALIDANAGTLGSAATGVGGRAPVRTWP